MDLEGFNIRPYRMKRLKSYCERMSRDDCHVVFDDNVAAPLRLQGFSIEEAPRSIYKVEKLYEALGRYSPSNAPHVDYDQHVRAGIALAYACFAKPKEAPFLEALPLTPQTIELVTSNNSGSAGLTNYGCSKAESKLRALERGLQTVRGEKAPEPCLAFKRTQFNDKTRLVWGYPYSMTVIEGLLAYPLNQQFKGGNTPMAFAITSGALGTKLRVAAYHKKYAYSLDMSSFDSSLSGKLIHTAFDILKTWFDCSIVEPSSGKTYGEIFHLVEGYFIHTPIVMPNSKLYLGKKHGVPSGSYFTQMVDSVVNTIIGGAVSSRFSLNVSRREIFVLGDDLLMWTNRDMDLDTIARYVTSTFGVKMHGAEKSKKFRFDEAVHYLGRDWPNGLPNLAQDEILKRMVYPERYRRYSTDPKRREKEVKLLLLSYASVYWNAWSIVQKSIGSDRHNAQGSQFIEYSVYVGDGAAQVNADHLSGLQRYLSKYAGHGADSLMTTVGTQYWL
nr:RNA-dependent RNA polymerase [Partitiviridae sp.]